MITIGANGMTPPMTGTATTPDLLEATMMDLATEAIMMDLTITTTGANGMTPPMTGTATTLGLLEATMMDLATVDTMMDLATQDPAMIIPATGVNPEPNLNTSCDS